MLTLLFDGIAYGMLLFVLSLGLAVTMGLMNFINLAHGAFAMAGGYILVLLMQRLGWPFLACLPAAFLVTAALGALLERTLYRPMYSRPHLDQVLFLIGLTFMAVAAVDFMMGSSQQNITLPDWLRQRIEFAIGTSSGAMTLGMGAYRLFIVVVCIALAFALQAVLSGTRFGSRLRAAVDDPRVAAGQGIPVNKVFLLTFATGSGLAGLDGALWVAIWTAPLLFARHAALINEIAILALFALSLDLILGYAGIVSLGHAAFLGIAYLANNAAP